MLSDDVAEKGYALLCMAVPQTDCKIMTVSEVGRCHCLAQHLLTWLVGLSITHCGAFAVWLTGAAAGLNRLQPLFCHKPRAQDRAGSSERHVSPKQVVCSSKASC